MKKPSNKPKAKPVTVAKPIAVKSAAAMSAPKPLPAAAAASPHDPLHNLLRDRYARKICGSP
jgi:hypothetical protein